MNLPSSFAHRPDLRRSDSFAQATVRATDLRTLAGRFALWRQRVNGGFGTGLVPPDPLWIAVGSRAEYAYYLNAMARESRRRRALEASLPDGNRDFYVPGYCWICGRISFLHVDYSYSYLVDGVETPNLREHLRCPDCQLNNRMRAAVHFFERALVAGGREPSVYMTEQCTPIYTAMSHRHPDLAGSEYFGDRLPLGGFTHDGLRNESLTRLTFPSASFDVVISLDVLEHVAFVERALAECRRVLRPGGALLFSVPFYPERETNLVRASEDEAGRITHHLPPEYHGDPLSTDGCLAYHHFGWELLDWVRRAGFARVEAVLFWSRGHGYLGPNNLLFTALTDAP